MFAFTGAGMAKVRHWANDGKKGRHSIDQWDRVCVPLFPQPPSAFQTNGIENKRADESEGLLFSSKVWKIPSENGKLGT